MSLFVLDCSIALAWAFESEWTPTTQALLRRCAATGAVVPGHWPLEVANALAVGERRGRLSAHDALRYIELLESLPLEVDTDTANRALRETFALARTYGLSSYDAAYLELAARRGLPLATQDRLLLEAARKVGTPVAGE
jgi:predicted nucleic acid-binding protein